jgi:RNA polymerase sigma-70 factor (ECF subfamily)
MLGSLTEAEDAVQETWIRLSRSDTESIDNLGGWLTTVLSRVCLGMLRSRRTRGEAPLEPEEPEPDGTTPEEEAVLADTLGPALLLVLDTLSPSERLAFVLHDLFAVPFEDIAPIVGRSAAANRDQGAPLLEPEVRGARSVAMALSGRASAAKVALIDGWPGAVWAPGGRTRAVFAFHVVGDRVAEIEIVTDPSVVAALPVEIV